MKMKSQRWPEMPLILGRSGTQYDAMVTKLLSSNCGAHLVESYCKESNISDPNSPIFLFSSYFIKIWLSVWRHHLANLHILKTWISLEQKEIFENSKKHFSLHVGCFDRKDAIFVIVAWFLTNRSMLPGVCSMIDHRSKCGKNKNVGHGAIYYWTDAGQHGIYLFHTITKQTTT